MTKKIYYEEFGDFSNGKSPMLLIHGWGTNINSYREYITLLSKDIPIYALDLPGFGKSDMPEKDWGTEQYADVVSEFLAKKVLVNGVNKVNLFGHSFGGAIAARVAASHQVNIDKLILCGPAIVRDPKIAKFGIPDFIKNLLKKSFIRKIYYRIFHPNSDMPFRLDLESNFKKVITESSLEYLASVKAMTLLVWGKNDLATLFSDAEKVASGLSSVAREFNDFDHYIPKKNSEYLAKVSRDFILKDRKMK